MASAAQITILDGGIGHLLKNNNIATCVSDTKWANSFLVAAFANVDAPQAVHEEYADSGADVITANNFPVTPWSLARVGKEDAFVDLTKAAAAAAREVADKRAASGGSRLLVAGTLPPLGESYAIESSLAEQIGGQQAAELGQPIYTQIAGLLQPLVDILICETMASDAEAWSAASAAAATGVPTWVSLTLDDSERCVLRSGEPLAATAAKVGAMPGVEAVLLNCCAPEAISAALPVLRQSVPEGVRIGAYANGFRLTTSEWLAAAHASSASHLQRDPGQYGADGVITPGAYVQHALQWVAAGATIVGGCCGIGPAHIRAVAEKLRPGSGS